MANKSISLSVRVSQQDAEFVAGLDLPGAATPSDKLRELIREARRRHEQTNDYNAMLALLEQLVRQAKARNQFARHVDRVQSELIDAAYEWLPETLAWLTTPGTPGTPETPGTPAPETPGTFPEGAVEAAAAHLAEIERGLADRIFALIERVLRLGVTQTCRCIDPGIIHGRLGPVMELAQLIQSNDSKMNKEN